MTSIVIWLCVAIGVVLVWKLSKSFTTNKYLAEIASRLTREEAEEQLNQSWGLVLMKMKGLNSFPISQKEANEHLERAVWMQDRINQLDGKSNGPAERLRIRAEFARQLRELI